MMKIKTVAGPDSYPTGGFEVEIGEFEKVTQAAVSVKTGSYHAGVPSITGNKPKVQVFVGAAGADTEVTAGTDLSGETFTIVAEGI